MPIGLFVFICVYAGCMFFATGFLAGQQSIKWKITELERNLTAVSIERKKEALHRANDAKPQG